MFPRQKQAGKLGGQQRKKKKKQTGAKEGKERPPRQSNLVLIKLELILRKEIGRGRL
jgi:hypothetical protein